MKFTQTPEGKSHTMPQLTVVRLSENGSDLRINESIRERNRSTGINDGAVGPVPDVAGAGISACIVTTTISAATGTAAAPVATAITATTVPAATVTAAARPATSPGFGRKHAQTGQCHTHASDCHDPTRHLESPLKSRPLKWLIDHPDRTQRDTLKFWKSRLPYWEQGG